MLVVLSDVEAILSKCLGGSVAGLDCFLIFVLVTRLGVSLITVTFVLVVSVCFFTCSKQGWKLQELGIF